MAQRRDLVARALAQVTRLDLGDGIVSSRDDHGRWCIENTTKRHSGWESEWLTSLGRWSNANGYLVHERGQREAHAAFVDPLDVLAFWDEHGEDLLARRREGRPLRVDEGTFVLPFTKQTWALYQVTPVHYDNTPDGTRFRLPSYAERWHVKGQDPRPEALGEVLLCGFRGDDPVPDGLTLLGQYR